VCQITDTTLVNERYLLRLAHQPSATIVNDSRTVDAMAQGDTSQRMPVSKHVHHAGICSLLCTCSCVSMMSGVLLVACACWRVRSRWHAVFDGAIAVLLLYEAIAVRAALLVQTKTGILCIAVSIS
jgi:hypothetical protein